MKSIKQQYIDLREGNMTQANFMRNLRMTLPQYVTNITSFEDSVQILKNKGILTEADTKEGLYNSYTDVVNAITKKYSYKVYHDEIEDFMQDKNSLEAIMAGKDPIVAYEEFYNIQRESLNEAKDEKGKWTNADGKSMYDQFSEINNLNGQEVLIGIDYEMQKNEELTKLEAQKIVIKNLKKIPNYYTNQDMSGVEGYEPEYIGGKSANAEARQMQPLEKNMGNIVDKKMGMQPVKNVEKVKKDSDKGGETNKMEKGVSLMSLIAKSTRGVQKMDATGEKMKKIVMKESRGEYTFVGTLNGAETEKVRTLLDRDPNINIEVDEEEGQRYDTYITSDVYTNKDIEHAVKMAKGEISSSTSPSSAGAGVAKFLTKERLKEMIRKEIAGAYGGDAMDAEDGSSYTND
jgi:hypothetical protein